VPKILIVDDETANRLLLSSILRYGGYDIIEAANGEAGLEMARQASPDLIIIDLWMPGMHGTIFMKMLRAETALSQTRVALYTASPLDAALQGFIELARIDAVIPKPSEPQEVLRVVSRVLS
jgi:CheY-like chemotaxis protein